MSFSWMTQIICIWRLSCRCTS